MHCCLIDLDGTLADSIPILWRAYEQFMLSLSLPAEREDFYALMGPSLSEIFTQLKERYRFDHDPKELAINYQRQLHRYYADEIPMVKGSKKVLLEFSAFYNYAIVTSAPASIAQSFLEAHQISTLFSAIVTAEGLVASKPNPEIYRKALEWLACKPEDAIAIEDSLPGVRSASDAGISTLWLTEETPSTLKPNVTLVSNWQQIGEQLQKRL